MPASVGVIGRKHIAAWIPAFAKPVPPSTPSSPSGTGPVHVGRKFGFRQASTDVHLLADTSCNAVIATRHDSHASLVQQALAAGKHVFVEKPLCLTAEELAAIEEAHTGEKLLMVGFNIACSLLIDLQNRSSALVSLLRVHLQCRGYTR